MITKQRASIALIVILIAATIAIVSYVMTNGTNPIGPSPVTPGSSDIIVSMESTPVIVTDEINFSDGNICAVAAALIADVSLCDDITIVDRLSLTTTDQEFIDITGAATMFFSTRDNVVFMLDNNNNTPGADLCIQGSGVTTDTWCVDKNGNITLATIDGDLNTFVDVKPDQWDNLDTPADEECATYESNQIEWQTCGGGSSVPTELLWASLGYAEVPQSNQWINSCVNNCDYVTQVYAADQLYLVPIMVAEDTVVDNIGIVVTTPGASGTGRIGTYASTGTGGLPDGAPVIDAGTFDCTSAASQTFSFSPVTLTGGELYWMALLHDCSASVTLYAYTEDTTLRINATTNNLTANGIQMLSPLLSIPYSAVNLPTLSATSWQRVTTIQPPRIMLQVQ